MRAKVLLSLVGATIAAVALVSASGAATAGTQKVARLDVSTRAAVVHYLRSIHVNPKGVVIERGRLNYAGAHCPGKGWTCVGTKHTVVQLAKRGGLNRFACATAKCSVVQLGGVSHGVYTVRRALASTTNWPTVTNTASCIKTTGVTQSCTINQPSGASVINKAVVWMVTPKLTGLAQSANYTALITQGPTSGLSSNWNVACVRQSVTIDGSTTKTSTASTTVTSNAHESVTIRQNSKTGNNMVLGAAQTGSNTYNCATDTSGHPDTTSPATQDQTLTSVVTSKGPITQNQDTTFSPCGDGVPGDYANLCFYVDQNQAPAYQCTGTGVNQVCPATGTNTATFTQNSTQAAIANTTQGPVNQTQSTPLCSTPSAPTNAPAGCQAPGGLVGTINQDSSGVSTATPTQNEYQCEDAKASGLTLLNCLPTSGTPSLPDPVNIPGGLHQTQYGPVGVGNLRHHQGDRRVLASHLKGLGEAHQHGGGGNDQYTIRQTSTQNADANATQLNLGKADCGTDGTCDAGQTTTTNLGTTQDGYQASSIGDLNITCDPALNNGKCKGTPPPDPTYVSGPTDPNPSASAAFNFTDSATGGFHFLCKIDGGTANEVINSTCSSGTAFLQGYGPHTFQVAASDGHGNVSHYLPSTPVSWTNVPPDPTITTSSEPANPEAWDGTDTFKFTDSESALHFQCTLDGGTPTACNTKSISYNALSSGEHTFSVRAYDTTDAYGSIHSATYTWWITPPDPRISSSPPDPDFLSSTPSFTFTDDDNTVQYQCQVDSDPAASCSSGVSYSGLSAGPHTFTVTAYGANDSGLTHPDTTPATVTWTILPLEVSALGGADLSSAGWACQPGGPIGLTVGSAPYDPPTSPGTFAQVAITDASGTPIHGLSEPTFTTDNYAAGSPRYVIDLSNGDYLFGNPPNSGLNDLAFAWEIHHPDYSFAVPPYVSWSDVVAFEDGQTVTDAYVVADGDQDPGTTDKIGSLQFNGTTYNSGTCS